MKGKKFIYYSIPLFGHLNSCLPLIMRLIDAGYQGICFSDIQFKKLIEATGAEFKAYSVDLKPYLTEDVAESYTRIFRTKLTIDRMMYDEVLLSMDSISPDFIMHDSMAGFAKYAAAKLNIRAINIITTLAINHQLLFKTPALFIPMLQLLFKHPFQSVSLVFEGIRTKKKYGFRQFPLTDPFINEENLNIMFSPDCFQPGSRTFGNSYFFARPTIEERNLLSPMAEEFPAKKAIQLPLIYISLGTITDDGKRRSDRLNAILDVLANYRVQIVLSLGGLSNIEITETENLSVCQFVSQLDILKKADLFINHGGLNSVYESIWFNVPQICIPSQTEQLVTGQIVKKIKCGICIHEFNVKKLEKAVGLLLNKNTGYGKQVENSLEAFSNRFKHSPDLDAVVNRIAEYLGTKKDGNMQ